MAIAKAKTTTQETTLKIIACLKKQGCFVWRQNNGAVWDKKKQCFRTLPKGAIKGVPDIIGFTQNGTFVGVEIKATGKLSEQQKAFIDVATKSNCLMFVVKDFEDFLAQWDDIKDK